MHIIHYWNGSSLPHIMVCQMYSGKPLHRTIRNWAIVQTEQIVDWATFRKKFFVKHIQFESENRLPSMIWKWRAFVPVFMCQTVLSHRLAHGIYTKNVPAYFVMRKLAARSYIIHFASCKCKFAIGWPILPKRKWGFPRIWPFCLIHEQEYGYDW